MVAEHFSLREKVLLQYGYGEQPLDAVTQMCSATLWKHAR